MSYRIYIVDDSVSRNCVFVDLLRFVEEECTAHSLPYRFENGNSKIIAGWNFHIDKWNLETWKNNEVSEGEAEEQVRLLLEDQDILLTAAIDPDSIMLLDTEYQSTFPNTNFQEVAEGIITKLKDSTPQKPLNKNGYKLESSICKNAIVIYNKITNNNVEGVSSLAAILAAIRIATGYQYLITSRYTMNGFQLNGQAYQFPGTLIPKAADARDEPNTYIHVRNMFKESLLEVASKITKYHDDPAINRALLLYATPWAENWNLEEGAKFQWDHESFTDKNCKLFESWLEIKVDMPSAQALGMVNKQDGKAYPHNVTSLYYYHDKKLTVAVMNALLHTLDIPGKVILPAGDNSWEPPVVPALPFFVSLRAFICKLNQEKAPPIKVEFNKYYDSLDRNRRLYSISIQLQIKRENHGREEDVLPFGMGARFFEGNCLGNTTESLKKLLYAYLSVSDLKTTYEWTKVFNDKKHEIDGRGTPCVGFCFHPFGVRLFWVCEGI